MLAPVSEAEFGERALLELGLESAKRYAALLRRARAAGLQHGGDAGRRSRPRRGGGTRPPGRIPDGPGPARRAAAPFAGAQGRTGARADDPAGAAGRWRPFDRPAAARRRARPRLHRHAGHRQRRGPARRGGEGHRRPAPGRLDRPRLAGRRGRRRRRRPARDARARARAGAPGQGPGPALARPERPRPRGAHDPRRARVPRPARRRPLRARRDDGGTRLGHDPDRGRHLRAPARHERARPGHLRARHRGAARGPAPGDARQPAGDRPRRARGPRLGDRALPQRHPAHAGDRGRRRRRARGEELPEFAAAADPSRFAGVHA